MNAVSNKDMAHKQNSLGTQTKGKVVAILGATGVVGTQMMHCLEERSCFPTYPVGFFSLCRKFCGLLWREDSST